MKGKRGGATQTTAFPTDYRPKTSGMQSKPSHGKIQDLRASVHRPPMPLEFVAEYNLAGGQDIDKFLYTMASGTSNVGMTGKLRFTNRSATNPETATNPNPHNNDESGYYNWYILVGQRRGVTDAKYNPNGHDLMAQTAVDVDGQSIRLDNKYFVPEQEDWWGVFPTNTFAYMGGNNANHIFKDYARIGSPSGYLRLFGSCSYSYAFMQGDNNMLYALRFAKANSSEAYYTPETWYGGSSTTYECLKDNTMAMAYKYTLVGRYRGSSLTTHLKIESYYLGEEGYNNLSAKTADGVKAAWSTFPTSEIVTRIFPISGYMNALTSPFGGGNTVIRRGEITEHPSATPYTNGASWSVEWGLHSLTGNGAVSFSQAYPARLFRLNPTY